MWVGVGGCGWVDARARGAWTRVWSWGCWVRGWVAASVEVLAAQNTLQIHASGVMHLKSEVSEPETSDLRCIPLLAWLLLLLCRPQPYHPNASPHAHMGGWVDGQVGVCMVWVCGCGWVGARARVAWTRVWSLDCWVRGWVAAGREGWAAQKTLQNHASGVNRKCQSLKPPI